MVSGVFSFCKAIDTFCPLGPWIVTPDEIPDPHDLRMELRVNGEAAPGVPLREHVGHDPGDHRPLLAARVLRRRRAVDRARSPASPGSARTPASLYLRPGDVMEAEIERIGMLRNPVISWQEAYGVPRHPASAGEAACRRRSSLRTPTLPGGPPHPRPFERSRQGRTGV